MRILVTGACGLVGQAIEQFNAGHHTLVPFDLDASAAQAGGVCGSITDRDAVFRAAEGCDAIIHTAAMHGAYQGKCTNQQFIETNVVGSEHIFQAALEFGIKRLVISSSLEVVCGYRWGASGITHYDQNTPPRPDWIYPMTKLMVEQLGSFYARHHGLEVVQLRYAWVRKEPIKKIGLGLLARSITSTDVADVNLRCVTTPGLRDEMFYVCPDSPLQIADMIKAQTDPWSVLEKYWPGCTPILREHNVEPKADVFWPTADIRPAKWALGWQPRSRFDRYLETLGWKPCAASTPPVTMPTPQ